MVIILALVVTACGDDDQGDTQAAILNAQSVRLDSQDQQLDDTRAQLDAQTDSVNALADRLDVLEALHDGEVTIPLAEWVAAFDQLCVDIQAELTPGLTDAEFAAISDRYLAMMRALPPPDEMADLAAELLDGLESSVDPDLDDAAIEALDQRAATLLTSLSVSQECIAGVPG